MVCPSGFRTEVLGVVAPEQRFWRMCPSTALPCASDNELRVRQRFVERRGGKKREKTRSAVIDLYFLNRRLDKQKA